MAVNIKRRNPATDPRMMRRVIAEDPDWNLETVPPLHDSCINHIVQNFAKHPLLNELKERQKEQVLNKLPPDIPIKITAPLINDEGYWERCCRARWKLCDVSDHAQSLWKIMYFERNAQEAVEQFVPEQSDLDQLEEILQLSSRFIRRLVVRQLLPPPQDKNIVPEDEETDGLTDDNISLKTNYDHLDCRIILKNLRQLQELQLTYGVRNCGMNFQWSFYDFTSTDCHLLSQALKATPTLKVFRLRESKVNDERGRVLIFHLLDHPSLTTLDLSHNCLGDGAGRALGKLLNDHSPKLTELNVTHNSLDAGAGASLGQALQRNKTLRTLKIGMNVLGDLGIQPILKALMKNETLSTLDISSNNIGEPSAPPIAEMLMANENLTSLNVACNKFGEGGGKFIQEGMEENKVLRHFDLRLTEISQESEYSINQTIKNNMDHFKLAQQLV